MGSGSHSFDALRDEFERDHALRQELEMYARIVLDNFNPSGRASRFVYGSLMEWGLALAAFTAGLLVLPDGHDADSTDLRGVVDQQRGLWSVKASADNKDAYVFILQNFRSDGTPPEYRMPTTTFLHPRLPGITIVVPDEHPEVVTAVELKRDCRVLPLKAVRAHALRHPECVIPFAQPANPGGVSQDEVTGLDLVRGIVDSVHFTRLKQPFQQAAQAARGDVVDRLREIQRMKDGGELSTSQAEEAVRRLLGN